LKKSTVSLVIVLPPVIAYATFAAVRYVRYVTAQVAAYEREIEREMERREAEAKARGAEEARRAEEIRAERIEAAKKQATKLRPGLTRTT
jgi:predicted Holliday junction resolvase-like endonuclease